SMFHQVTAWMASVGPLGSTSLKVSDASWRLSSPSAAADAPADTAAPPAVRAGPGEPGAESGAAISPRLADHARTGRPAAVPAGPVAQVVRTGPVPPSRPTIVTCLSPTSQSPCATKNTVS